MATVPVCTGSVDGLHRSSIVLFGDSITQEAMDVGGWAALLAHAYRRKADVVVRGFSGYNTRMARHLAPLLFPPETKTSAAGGVSSSSTSKQVLFTTIFFGANDACDNARLPPGKPAQGVPVPEFEANLRSLIVSAAAVSRAVVVISPPPVDTAAWPDRDNGRVAAYTAACASAVAWARGEGVAAAPTSAVVLHVNLFRGFGGEDGDGDGDWKPLLSDGLHLSAAGSSVVARMVLEALAEGGGAGGGSGAASPAPSPSSALLLPDALALDVDIWRDVPPEEPGCGEFFGVAHLAELHAVAQAVRK
jgi:lysophospholipase L1-like esterase